MIRPRRSRCLVLGLAMVGVLGVSLPSDSVTTSAVAAQRPFVVFDATLYKNKPSFSGYPIRPIKLLYESRLFPKGQPHDALPPEGTVRSVAKELRGAPEGVVIDIERWPLKGDPKIVKENVGKILAILSWIKAEAPDLQLGAYGTVPLPDYWRAIRGPGNKDFQAWQQDNDRLDEMAARLNALYPTLYTYYPDRQGWVQYAVAQLTEAKRKANGKPVYAFLWPQYHDSNKKLRLQPVEPEYWELQLNTVSQHADGVVIWGGWGEKGPESWNEEAPWWEITKRFLGRMASNQPGRPRDLTVQ
ncbi:MAG: hypothetical protein KF876_00860 [Nitrospira sp.]|nr:hypothetical protein [Nitrospira sp.]